ncbi:uncharacterized protein LOC141616939 [Silene latifolia]|uniref:uncharacterized protein LOC141616939 n=1 Tax=Silene latifolia TaxID=37657 RepID=UPI003D775563
MEESEGGGYVVDSREKTNRRGAGVAEARGWEPPKAGVVKINVDAGAKEGEGVTWGAVCRDSTGRVLWGFARVQDQYWEPQIAEAVAIFEGVREAARRGHEEIVLESDCLMVVEALKKKAVGRNMLALVLSDILSLCNVFVSVFWSFTSRTNNSVAHALAHLFPRVVGRSVWSEALPPSANNAVIFDSLLMQ